MKKCFAALSLAMSVSTVALAERYVGVVSPSANVAVGKCNDTCVYLTFGHSKEELTKYRLGSCFGYAYNSEDYEFSREILQGLRDKGHFVDVQNNNECMNSFFETHSLGEISVGADNVTSECYQAVRSTLDDKGFNSDEVPSPSPAKSDGSTNLVNHALGLMLLLNSR